MYFQYTTQRGEDLNGIAQRFSLAAEYVVRNNPTMEWRGGRVPTGTVLRIPAEPGMLHTGIDGQTVDHVASRYGVDIASVVRANRLASDDAALAPGSVLLVPGARLECP